MVQTWEFLHHVRTCFSWFFIYSIKFLIRLKAIIFYKLASSSLLLVLVIMSIGLILSPVAVNMAMGKTGDGSVVLVPFEQTIIISMVALVVTILVSLLEKEFFFLIPFY